MTDAFRVTEIHKDTSSAHVVINNVDVKEMGGGGGIENNHH